MSDEPSPIAPSSIAWRTRARIRANCSGVGSTSLRPSSWTRTVEAPTIEAMLTLTPFFSRKSRNWPSVVQLIG
jgi:hypothetical protein